MINWLTDELTHRLLVEGSACQERFAIARANYLEAYQKSLDLNQDGATLAHWEEERAKRALELVSMF